MFRGDRFILVAVILHAKVINIVTKLNTQETKHNTSPTVVVAS